MGGLPNDIPEWFFWIGDGLTKKTLGIGPREKIALWRRWLLIVFSSDVGQSPRRPNLFVCHLENSQARLKPAFSLRVEKEGSSSRLTE